MVVWIKNTGTYRNFQRPFQLLTNICFKNFYSFIIEQVTVLSWQLCATLVVVLVEFVSITLQQALTSASVDQGLKAQRVIWVISILSSSVFLRLLQIPPHFDN